MQKKKKKVTEVFILSLGIRGKAESFSESHNHRGSAKSQVWEPRKRAKAWIGQERDWPSRRGQGKLASATKQGFSSPHYFSAGLALH